MTFRTVHRGSKDLLHAGIGKLFADHGWDTLDISGLSGGAPDWAIFRGEIGFLLEVKTEESRRPGKGHDERGLNQRQQDFHALWKSRIYIVASLAEAWDLLDKYPEPSPASSSTTSEAPAAIPKRAKVKR